MAEGGMTTKIRLDIELVHQQCGKCGVSFGLESRYYNNRHDDHDTFYCPNGHGRAFLAESEAERLRRLLKNAEATADWERDTRQGIERQLTATRGVVTKLRKRATAGACPFGCKRHFVNLERHVASKHPDQQLEGELA
jgi:hypothetical protein